MHTNVEYSSCGEVGGLGYFQLSDMRYDYRNKVIERLSTSPATLLKCTQIAKAVINDRLRVSKVS